MILSFPSKCLMPQSFRASALAQPTPLKSRAITPAVMGKLACLLLGTTALMGSGASGAIAQSVNPLTQDSSAQNALVQDELTQAESAQNESAQNESTQDIPAQEASTRQPDPQVVVVPPVVSQVIEQAETSPAVTPPDTPSPEPAPFSPAVAGIVNLLDDNPVIDSVGHLRPQEIEALQDDDVDWLKSIILPLYGSPGGEHWGWIYEGWLIPKGQNYLAIGRDAGFAMVQTYENLYTFPVLELREDGWFRVQYTQAGSAWAHTSQLELGAVALTVEGWEQRLQAQESVYFLEQRAAQPLRSQPAQATNMLSLVAADSLIEPLGFQGDWMQVRVTRPAATCEPLTGATVTEGWMRWRGEEGQALAWFNPDGSCPQ